MLPESFIERHDTVLPLLGPYREDSLAPFLAQLRSARAEQSLPLLVDDDNFRFGDGDAVEERGGREPSIDGDSDSAEEMARPPAAPARVRPGDWRRTHKNQDSRYDPLWKVAHRNRDSVAFPHAVLVEEGGEAQDPLVRVSVGKPFPLVDDVFFIGKSLQAGPSLRQPTRSLSGV